MSEILLDLFKAYYSARQNKRNTYNALKFELCYEHNLIEICDEIINCKYEPRPSICFIVNKPVKREVFAADFRDRIIHHLVFNYISPVFEKQFINDSYSCRKGKGIHYGINRVNHFIRSCSENYHSDYYILKMDIQGYFMSIDRLLLYEKVNKAIVENACKIKSNIDLILYLIGKTIFNDPKNGCIIKSKMSEWKGLPPSKSLFYAGKNKGLPIGNLTSQLFANFYLDEFDHFMKRQMKLKYYGRYVDDIVVVHQDHDYLKSVISAASEYLTNKLMLQLHPRKIYLQHYSKGVVFLGAVVKPYRIYVANRTKSNFYHSIQSYNHMIAEKIPSTVQIKQFICSMNSYLGIVNHYHTANLREHLISEKLSPVWWKYVNTIGRFKKFVIKRG